MVSDVLRGKRGLNKDPIRRLSQRFHHSPELFLSPLPEYTQAQDGKG
jgi:antitoxin component HigA of HigAB toxin-antitoxin module